MGCGRLGERWGDVMFFRVTALKDLEGHGTLLSHVLGRGPYWDPSVQICLQAEDSNL